MPVFVLDGDARKAIRELEATQKAVQKLKQQLRDMGKANEQAQRKGRKGALQQLVVLEKLKIGYRLASQLIQEFSRAASEELAKQLAVIVKADEAMRRFRVQAGLSEIAGQKAETAISASAERAAVSFDQAEKAARQLISSGFAVEEVVQGGALDKFLEFVNATNAVGKGTDLTTLSKSFALFMESTSQDKTTQQLGRTAVAAQNLFGDTNLQVKSLERYSAVAATITEITKLDPSKQLAVLATLLGSLSDEQASTQFRNFATAMATIANESGKVEALKKLGLVPKQVDFVGESFLDVVGRLREGLKSVDQETRNLVLTKLFGRENIAGPALLTQNMGKVIENMGKTRNVAKFAEAVEIATTGPAAEFRQSDERIRRMHTEDDFTVRREQTRRRMNEYLIRAGVSPFMRGLQNWEFDFLSSLPLGAGEKTLTRTNENLERIEANQRKVVVKSRGE